jgi:hypothetical protein
VQALALLDQLGRVLVAIGNCDTHRRSQRSEQPSEDSTKNTGGALRESRANARA